MVPTVSSWSWSYKSSATTYPQCYQASIKDSNNRYVIPSENNLYALSTAPYTFTICQESAAHWALRTSKWCGVTGTLTAAWLSCTANGPGPHELFEGRCLPGGYSHIAYGYGEVSNTGNDFNNWVANAGPRYSYLLSFSPSHPDPLYINHFCN